MWTGPSVGPSAKKRLPSLSIGAPKVGTIWFPALPCIWTHVQQCLSVQGIKLCFRCISPATTINKTHRLSHFHCWQLLACAAAKKETLGKWVSTKSGMDTHHWWILKKSLSYCPTASRICFIQFHHRSAYGWRVFQHWNIPKWNVTGKRFDLGRKTKQLDVSPALHIAIRLHNITYCSELALWKCVLGRWRGWCINLTICGHSREALIKMFVHGACPAVQMREVFLRLNVNAVDTACLLFGSININSTSLLLSSRPVLLIIDH